MIFALLVLLSAFLIEGIGTYVSVVGLSALFAHNPVIIVLAIALDIGKVISVSFLYKYWKKVNWLMKSYMTVAAVVLMIITSMGCFGYLSREFQTTIAATNQNSILEQSLTDEQSKLQHRKEEIDKQIAQLPDNFVKGRKQLIAQFKPEEDRINARLAEIDKQLPDLKIESIKKNVDVGPIVYVAQAFGTDPEHAVKWVILVVIFVFDPLAIALLLAGNFLLLQREQNQIPTEPDPSFQLPHMTLTGKDRDVFVEALTNPPPPTEKLVRAAERYREVTREEPPLKPPPMDPIVAATAYGPQATMDFMKFRLDKTDEELHRDLGRHKTVDLPDPPAPAPVPTSKNVLPSGPSKRETILMSQVRPPPRSSLEDVPGRDATSPLDQDTRPRSDLKGTYQDNSVKVR